VIPTIDLNMTIPPKMKTCNCNWVQVSGHWECKLIFETSSCFFIGDTTENYTWSTGAILPDVLVKDCHFYSCSSPPAENMLFRINDLRNSLFVSLFF
jgi:hypothetical protein